MESKGKSVEVVIWDTGNPKQLSIIDKFIVAGQERFHSCSSLGPFFYRETNGAFVVFDIAKIASFRNLNYWIQKVREHSPNSIMMV